ncbi:MAG TPA: hypothetical protein VJ464_10980 [Blastocatellia bacterium]|nr:hypothetical protein [Blastocatellia bacterium]
MNSAISDRRPHHPINRAEFNRLANVDITADAVPGDTNITGVEFYAYGYIFIGMAASAGGSQCGAWRALLLLALGHN